LSRVNPSDRSWSTINAFRAVSADCGITFPVTPLTTIIDVSRALVDTGSLGDQHAFLARIFPFSPVFSSTLEIFREITPGLEDELVDCLVTHSFFRMVDRETTGNLLGAPTELQFLFDVSTWIAISRIRGRARLNFRLRVDRAFAQWA